MNHFEIKIVESSNESFDSYKEVKMLIDGIDLIEILKKFELPFATRENHADIAGAYSGIPTEYITSDQLLGKCNLFYGDNSNKVPVLECECGCEGCWPFAVKITETDSSIIWSDFEQPHRSDEEIQPIWDYSDLCPFEFDKTQYIEELNKLAQPKPPAYG